MPEKSKKSTFSIQTVYLKQGSGRMQRLNVSCEKFEQMKDSGASFKSYKDGLLLKQS